MGNIGSDDQCKVIKMITKNTGISEAICKAGYVRSDESQVAMAQSVQREKLVKIALQTEHEQGHAVDDKRAWVASSLSSAVLTPPSFKSNEDNSTNQPVRKKLSFRKQAKVHGLSPATGWRYLSRALKKRKLMELNSKDIFCFIYHQG